MAYDVERHMTIPAPPPGTRAAEDRVRVPARRRRGLRAVLTATVALGAAAVAVVAGIGLVKLAGSGQPVNHTAAAGSAAARSAVEGSSRVKPAAVKPAALPPLSPAQLAGQRVIYSYSGLTPPASLLRWIRAGEVGGVIFFTGNISSRSQLAAAAAELNQANASPGNPLRHYPLLLMTDQEGGLVRRRPGRPICRRSRSARRPIPLRRRRPRAGAQHGT